MTWADGYFGTHRSRLRLIRRSGDHLHTRNPLDSQTFMNESSHAMENEVIAQ